MLEGCHEVSTKPSLLQAEQAQISQPDFTGEVPQYSYQLHDPPLDLIQQVHAPLILGTPQQYAVFQVGVILILKSNSSCFAGVLVSIHNITRKVTHKIYPKLGNSYQLPDVVYISENDSEQTNVN